jgi:hypothetical protein
MATPVPAALDPAALDRLRADLEAVDGVRRAVIDGPPYTVYVIADAAHVPTDMVVHSVLSRHGLSAAEATVSVCHLPAPEPRRRVRFVSARVEVPRPGRAEARVELEWGGRTHAGEMDGESGAAWELRLSAMATLQALEGVLGGRVSFHLVGIKPFRAFDADVVVALVRSDVDGRSLIGAALAADDPHRAAAVAVLSATNRVLGNYLSNEEALNS